MGIEQWRGGGGDGHGMGYDFCFRRPEQCKKMNVLHSKQTATLPTNFLTAVTLKNVVVIFFCAIFYFFFYIKLVFVGILWLFCKTWQQNSGITHIIFLHIVSNEDEQYFVKKSSVYKLFLYSDLHCIYLHHLLRKQISRELSNRTN